MNTRTTFQSKSQRLNPFPASTDAPSIEQRLAPLNVDDLATDIERLISKIILPYVDPTSFALNAEDLRSECRAKLARIISEGHLAKCPTRAKAFAFIKVAIRNHVRSLVEKNVFSMKRTGYKSHSNESVETVRKPFYVRIDDPEIDFQLGKEDVSVRQREFLEELFHRLSPSEIALLNDLINKEDGRPTAAKALDATNGRSLSQAPENVKKARTSLLKKCLVVLADCD